MFYECEYPIVQYLMFTHVLWWNHIVASFHRLNVAYTVVPAMAGHRWFRGKVALRGRWPLVTGNGHMRIMSNQTHTSDSIYFTANAQQYKAQRSITMLYTMRDETNNAENV